MKRVNDDSAMIIHDNLIGNRLQPAEDLTLDISYCKNLKSKNGCIKTLLIYDDNYMALGVRYILAESKLTRLKAIKIRDQSFEEIKTLQPDVIIWVFALGSQSLDIVQCIFAVRSNLKSVRQIIINNNIPSVFTGFNEIIHGLTFLEGSVSVDSFKKTSKDVFLENKIPHKFWARKILTERQCFFIFLFSKGLMPEAIAHDLSLSVNTLLAHKYQIKHKLKIETKLQARWISKMCRYLQLIKPGLLWILEKEFLTKSLQHKF